MLLILCGKSGCGKDTIAQELCGSGDVSRLVSSTSRPMRDGEVNGREYNFYSADEMQAKIDAGEMIEYRAYGTLVGGKEDTWVYGTEKFTPSDDIKVAIKDLEGAKILKDYCEEIGEQSYVVYITCPDKIREERAKARGSFDQTEWDRRLSADAKDFSDEKIALVADLEVSNDGKFLPKGIANHIARMVRAEMHKDPMELFEEIDEKEI